MAHWLASELLAEVLRRLDVESLLRSAACCRSWRRVILNRAFLSDYRLLHPGAALCLCFYEDDGDGTQSARGCLFSSGSSRFVPMGTALPRLQTTAAASAASSKYQFCPAAPTFHHLVLQPPSEYVEVYLPSSSSSSSSSWKLDRICRKSNDKLLLLQDQWRIAPTPRVLLYSPSGSICLEDVLCSSVMDAIDKVLRPAHVSAVDADAMVLYCWMEGELVSYDLRTLQRQVVRVTEPCDGLKTTLLTEEMLHTGAQPGASGLLLVRLSGDVAEAFEIEAASSSWTLKWTLAGVASLKAASGEWLVYTASEAADSEGGAWMLTNLRTNRRVQMLGFPTHQTAQHFVVDVLRLLEAKCAAA